uniref:Response regulator receiver protein n=1 Tax=Cyanothece sp. (strain PCC 7425 / ATCC 29141) TaxID=395961 RepID=B8HZB5_CYAP4
MITEVFSEEQHCLGLLEFCKSRQVPVIVLTGYTDPYEQEVQEFVEAYYKKPTNPRKILTTLLSLANTSRVSHHLNIA